jgi:arylsulfatase
VRRRPSRTRIAGWLVALPLLLACGDAAPVVRCGRLQKPVAPPSASVVLVLNDTMRADRMSILGGPARTPNYDRFARENLWFTGAVSQAPWTKPSVATLFTSLYPRQHGVLSHPAQQLRAGQELGRKLLATERLPDSAATLAEAFQAAGFRTGAFVANPWLDRRFGYEQGFDTYDDSFGRWGMPGEQVMQSALAWLATLDPGDRFFLYVHTIDTHRPYPAVTWDEVEDALRQPPPPGELSLAARREIKGLIRIEGGRPPGAHVPSEPQVVRRAYDKGIERWDTVFGDLLRGLARDPRYDRTAVLVTSDHGEALYDLGYGNHGLSLYQTDVAVPLAVRFPGAGAATVECRVGLIDVMPTLCEWNRLACPSGMAGRSFLAGGGEELDLDRAYVSEASMLDANQRAAFHGRYKLIHSPGRRAEASPPPRPWSLFDLRDDPHETRDLLGDERRPARVEKAFASLRLVLDRAAASPSVLAPEEAPVDPQLEQRLRSLGYVE